MRTRGFTIVELILVISIIAILAAILFPVFARSREKARASSCMANLVNIAVALRSYAHDHDGWYPPTEDDLTPLIPRYIDLDKCFQCPSTYDSNIPMGAPADEARWRPPQPENPSMDPGMDPGIPGMGAPPSAPPPPQSHLPGVDLQPGEVVFAQGMPSPSWPEDTIMTGYYYRAGRSHNQTPLAPLCSDHKLSHNYRANVLFSDGAIKLLPEGPWRELGFETPEEIRNRRDGQGPTAEPWGGPPPS